MSPLKDALILAAGKGERLRPLTEDRPKALVELGAKPILQHMLEALDAIGIVQWTIVVGYRQEALQKALEQWQWFQRVYWIDNPIYEKTNTLYSVHLAADRLAGKPFLLINGDVWTLPQHLERLIHASDEHALLIDPERTLDGEAMKVQCNEAGEVHAIGKTLNLKKADGEAIGAYRFGVRSSKLFFKTLASRLGKGGEREYYEAAMNQLYQRGRPFWGKGVVLPSREWAEIDDARDLQRAQTLVSQF